MNRIILSLTALILITSCNPLKQINTTYQAAESNYSSQSYETAYNNYTSLIQLYKGKGMDIPNDIYLKAAECASKLGNTSDASALFQDAMKDSLSVVAVKGYINSLKKEQNYTDVVKVLSDKQDFLTENGEEAYLKLEKFEVAIAQNDTKEILATYSDIDTLSESQVLAVINAMQESDNEKGAMNLANKTLKTNPKFYDVKEWKAVYHYKFAEKWYKSEMDKYNKDKNYTAYVYLKRELKKISANYRVSKDLFEELHKVYPSETKYIKYLKNTYLRLELDKQAEAMDKLLK